MMVFIENLYVTPDDVKPSVNESNLIKSDEGSISTINFDQMAEVSNILNIMKERLYNV